MTTLEFTNQILQFQEKLSYFAISLTSDKDDADDLIQETYLKALSNKDKYSDQTNLKAWVYTIMKNTFINNYRRNYKSSARINSTDDPYQLDTSRDKYIVQPDSKYSEKEIMNVIDKLDDDYRLPFKMHLAGYKYKEISDELGLLIGTVKSRIFHARRKLMDELRDFRYSN